MGTLAEQSTMKTQMETPDVKRAEALSQNADQFINGLFEELAGIFPAWRSAFDSQQAITTAKRVWFEALSENKIKRSEIEVGLQMARLSTKPFLPSVGQFMAWCREVDYEALGLPDLEMLLKRLNLLASFGLAEVHRFRFKSNAEYWLLTELYQQNRRYGWSEQTLRTQAQQALAAMVERIKRGEQIPEPRYTLPKRVRTPKPPEAVINQRFAEMWQKLGVQR